MGVKEREETAANLIRRQFLQYVTRKQFTSAAVTLQANWRMILAKRTLNLLLRERRLAASISMQRTVRGYLARKQFSHLVQQQIAHHFQAIYLYAQDQLPQMIPSLALERPSEAQFEVSPLWAKLYSILPLPPAPPGCVPKHIPDVPDDYRVPLDDPNVPAFLRDVRKQDITTQLLLDLTSQER